jgi:hypothetical protein
MAIFPQGLSNVDQRCNAGERRVLNQLKRCLGDDYWVWHDVPIGPRSRQPDFVVLSPRQGVLLLEVKGWKRDTLAGATRDSVSLRTARGPVTEANPLRQARDYALELVHLMQADPLLVHGKGLFEGKLIFPYGWGVVFSHLSAAEVAGTDFHEVFPENRCLLGDDLADSVDPGQFGARLWGMFTVAYPHTLSLPQRDRIRWHLFPELRMSTQAALDLADAAALPALPDLLQVMDLQQEQIARTLGEGHRVIHGAAGSGKTMLLIYRAEYLAQAARPDRPVLVLCFNRPLADRIDDQLRQRGVDERVQVRTFHGWCQDVKNSYQLDIPPAGDRDAQLQALVRIVERALQTGFVPSGQYSALLVDEAHDFDDDWLRMAVRLVDPATNSLLVLYDDAQSIYHKRRRKFSLSSVGIQAKGRTSILRMNYRNTAEVLSLAVQCAQSLLQDGSEEAGEDGAIPLVQPASAGRRGAVPVLLEASHARDEAVLVAERVAGWLAQGRGASDIAVLARTKYLLQPIERELARRQIPLQSMGSRAARTFDWRLPSVKLMTLHSAKGLEFQAVHVAGLQAMPMKDESLEDAARLLYVAMTRATHELGLSACGGSPVVERVRQSLSVVQRQLAG